jgi:ATP-dependent Clp protease ATP-binding subunit ClpA|nr:MAG TPA: DNA packaging protein [Herelleviridae sp.]
MLVYQVNRLERRVNVFDNDRLNEAYPMLRDFASRLGKPAREVVGREKEKVSLMSALARPEMCNAILLAPPGTGKAHPNDELIPVADERGYVRIGMLKVGDRVFDEHGDPVTVTGVFPQGVLREYKVVTNKGQSTRCNDEHLWTVRIDDGEWQTLSLRELMNRGLTDMFDGRHPVCKLPDSGALVRQSRLLPVDPYVCGAFLGWGARIDERGYVSMPNEAPDEVFAAIEERMGWKRQKEKSRSIFIHEGTGKRVEGSQVMTHPAFTSLIVKGEKERRIPRLYMTSSIHDRQEMARALRESISYRRDDPFDMDVLPDAWMCPWAVDYDLSELERSFETSGEMISFAFDTGREVEMTCIMVDSDTHLYQVGRDHIVTHNTVLVQSCMEDDPARIYLEVDMAKMISDLSNPEEMAARLKALFDEAEAFSKAEGREVVLFIDEFHQVVQLSSAAVEALKPLLAASGSRGIKVIAATTYDEFDAHIASNLPLVERLARINIPQTNRRVTIEILKAMAQKYGVDQGMISESLYEQIFDYTNRYVPASVQPRKSIRVLDAMVGRHRYLGEPMDKKLLATVLKVEFGVEVEINVDATAIKAELDKRVFSQDFATTSIARRLQLCVAGLNDPSKPMASLLLTGSSGVGKCCVDHTMVPVWTEDGSVSWKRHGDLVVGDYVFARDGSPTKVLGVFPQGERDVYRVTFGDGRTLDVSDNHLWAVYPNRRSREEGPTIYSTQTLMNKGLVSNLNNGRQGMKYVVPMNQPVQWPIADLSVDPYALGALIANGSLTDKALSISSDDEETVARVGQAVGAVSWDQGTSNYSWYFRTGETLGNNGKRRIQLADVFTGTLSGLIGVKSPQRFIPEQYLHSSIEQRWALVQGLFDCDGSIGACDGERYNISYSTASERLAEDVRILLLSLGVPCSIKKYVREKDGSDRVEYNVHVKAHNSNKHLFFRLDRKKRLAIKAQSVAKQREKRFDYVGIRSIEKLDRKESMTCIYVDNDEHLYQAGDFIVTHNTEVTKQLAKILFGDDQRHLVRFDMSEWGRDDSVDLFREELARHVWATSHCVLLFDEIEKASPLVVRLLLQVLDDGRLSDKDGRQVSFLNTYIVLTTNAGSEIYRTIGEYNADDHGSEETMRDYEKIIETSIKSEDGGKFPPELLGRIDAIVPFQPLSRATLRKIMTKKLAEMITDVKRKHGIHVTVDGRVLEFLVEDEARSDSDSGGARDMVRRMQRFVTTEIAAFINEHPHERNIAVRIEGTLRSEDVSILKSDARVVVQPYDAVLA